jgi:zinc and cadmium transporter
MLIQIVAGTLLAGVASVWLAWVLSKGFLSRYPQHMLSLAAGALLATAFINLMPEAFESEYSAHSLFLVFFLGLLVVIVLDKAEVWHHAHEHEHEHEHGRAAGPCGHQHAHDARGPTGSWSVLFGDGVHAFADGILIASAFLADWKLGLAATFAVLLHEVPHHMGDLTVVGSGSRQPGKAVFKVSLAGSMTVAGGLVGYLIVGQLGEWLPLFLVFAASSFAYVALADLIPQLNRPMGLRQTLVQMVWLLAGSLLVTAAVAAIGEHAH